MTDNNEQYVETFAFGDNPQMADELLELVVSGKKTATVSVILDGDHAPAPGDLSLVLDGKGRPACVIKTISTTTVPFQLLTWDMVKLEGEDESFEDWRAGNKRYWNRDAENRGYSFTEDTPVLFEIFELVRIISVKA
ncbi:MAG TPA: ASCH domain-containing protein [Ruminococcaceae bacterium]|nr:ASCH domain-containing protein [Oscillospiraceae bacterium]